MNSKLLLSLALIALIPGAHAASTADEQVGKSIAPITLPSNRGKPVKLPTGKWTVLYFYPKDDTPGCTTQACSYRDNLQRFESLRVDVFGVSADDLDSHASFAKKHRLNFPLLSDAKRELASSLGVKGTIFLSRDTFLIDPKGKIVSVWRGVNPSETVAETLATVKQHLASPAAH